MADSVKCTSSYILGMPGLNRMTADARILQVRHLWGIWFDSTDSCSIAFSILYARTTTHARMGENDVGLCFGYGLLMNESTVVQDYYDPFGRYHHLSRVELVFPTFNSWKTDCVTYTVVSASI